jgi:hypothetical protein
MNLSSHDNYFSRMCPQAVHRWRNNEKKITYIDPSLFHHIGADHICVGMGRLTSMASSPTRKEIASAGPGFIFF